MMKITTKGRYGTRLLLDLAVNFGGNPILLKDIAKRQDISEKYLGHLIPPLKLAGLINSSRGAHGGYMLAKAPNEITFSEIIKAVEGHTVVTECVSSPSVCNRSDLCVCRDVWTELSEKTMEILRSITLQDVVKKQIEMQKSKPLMYYI
ncbi:MAG: Rrf2 family transcriptional regulator [Spirochaetota bacterium]|nr:Rrf2 family transcriptional regulator [Spirochaetota bacterium]